ncbi:MAG: hypothetical protein QOD92_707 [Acidimicrobiaceae bacterium]|jgi:dipeptidyl aminopeptidase/acylaminoacyl peptidase
MSGELDLRGVHQSHQPDPAFVVALEQRLEAVLAGTTTDDLAIDGRRVIELDAPAPTTGPAPRRRMLRAVLAAAAVIVLLAALAVIARRDDTVTVGPTPTPAPAPAPIGPRANGWVAQGFGSGIWIERDDGREQHVDYPEAGGSDEACPAFSPDGARLMLGRRDRSTSAAALDILLVNRTDSLLKSIPLDGIRSMPCAIWASDGRWAALGGAGSVWVVDTETAEVRQLPGYDATDLEWRPGTDELAITGRGKRGSSLSENAPIDVYTVSTREVRTVGDVEASELTWSPDGTTIAFTSRADPGNPAVMSGITLIDADGSNPRPLTTDSYVADHGIGVVWSPRGDLIAYQRARADCNGDACYERSEVVLVTATGTDPANPIGTERAVPPLVNNLDLARFTDRYNGLPPFHAYEWYADSVTWSPDGTQLLYVAGTAGLLTVPVDGTQQVVVLSGDALIGPEDESAIFPWIPLQQWQPLP